jgi:gamma-glutamyltranspeptidase/glutathione hydrolase
MKAVLIIILTFVALPCFAASPAPAEAKNAMVVSTQHLATQVGLNILKEGGNAVDAAVAIGYALAVVEPCCGNIGGGGFMLIHQANGKNHFIDFRETAPLAINQSLYKTHGKLDSKKIQTGYLAAGVPGTVMGLNYALKQYGTMPLKQVIQPAIKLAEKGFVLESGDVRLLTKATDKFLKQPNAAKIFLKNGKPYKAGEILKQNDLAHSLKTVQEKGDPGFYDSWIAKAIVKASSKHGGVLSLQDFRSYRIYDRRPVICHYRGYTIMTAPPPSSGGITLCEMLNILSAYPLADSGFHSAESVHYLVEAMRYAFADRNQYLGDPAFVKIPQNQLLSQEHAAAIRSKIKLKKAGNSKDIGFIKVHTNEKMETTSYAVVDKHDEAVEVTYTINGYFGSDVIAGKTGFFLNNEMDDFSLQPGIPNMFGLIQGTANSIAPGKRPLSSMTPTIVTKDGKVVLVTGAAGGSTIITQVLATIVNVIDYDMNIQEAIDAPRIHMQWLPDKIFMEPFAFSRDTEKLLEGMGYHLQLGSPYNTQYWGASVAIMRGANGRLYGAVDSRRPAGLAKGY